MNETTKMPKDANPEAIAACTAPGEAVAMSFAQQQLWFLQNLDPQLTAYNLPRVFRMKGALDADALERAFQALVERHAVLRTRFFIRDGAALQTVQAEAAFGIERIDLRSEAPASREEKLDDVVRRTVSHVFDLDVAPALVARLVRLADDEHVLAICLHHIVSDAWSNPILAKDLADAYAAALRAPGTVHLPALPLQYVDYARWQRERAASGAMQRDLDHWNAHLGSEVPALELPTDHARPEQLGFDGAATHFALEAPLCEALLKFCRAERSTPFVVMFAAWQVVLARYSGQYDFAVGVPSAGRHREELHGMLGFFVTTQVFRARLAPQMSLREICRQVRGDVLAALDHADLPFDVLLASRTDRREAGRTPLFQVMFGLQMEDGAQGPVLEGLDVRQMERPHHSAKFELSLDLTISGSRVTGQLEYNTALYDRTTVDRMAKAYLEVLKQFAADAECRVGNFDLLDAPDRQQLQAWENGEKGGLDFEPVHRFFERQASVRPDATALVFGDQALSYAELNRRANRLAHHLARRGVGPESLVGVAVERSIEMVVALFAILKAGGAYVPFDPEYPADRWAYMLADSGVELLLTQSHLVEQMSTLGRAGMLLLDTLDTSAEPESDPKIALHGDSLAYVIYTSGSTGKPKGAANRHRALCSRLVWMQEAYQLGEGDAVLQKTPFSFDVSVWEFFWPLMYGARLVVANPGDHREPERLVALIRKHGIDTLHFVPSMLQAFLAYEDVEACTSLRRIVCSGEALPVETQNRAFKRLPQAALYNLYGPTEAAIDVTHWTCRDDGRGHVPIGRPIHATQVRVLDAQLNPAPVGVVGELYLGGVNLARGYLNRATLTSERFIATDGGQRLYRTGDLACWNADGQLEYRGRTDHQVKVRGFRIELGEIEAQMLAQAGVREAAVVVSEGPAGGRLVGYLSVHAGQQVDVEQLKLKLGQVLPDYMVPGVVVVLESLPLNANGKVDRKALPTPEFASERTYEAPEGDVEVRLAAIWAEVLGVPRVGRNDNFFELGGHSLLALSLLERMRAHGWRVQVRTLFRQPRLAAFVQALAQEQGGTEVVVPENRIPMGCEAIRPEMLTLIDLDDRQIESLQASVLGGAANIQDIYPLAPLQQGMLFHHMLQTEGDAYVTRHVLSFDTRERLERFIESFNTIIERHDILRTAVLWEGLKEPVQVVQREARLHLQWATEDRDLASGAETGERPADHRVDVRRAPMIHATGSFSASRERWQLQLLTHHLVLDHTTLELLVEEIALVQQGRHAELPETVPYRRYVAQARLGVSQAEHDAFFSEMLADVQEPTAPFNLLNVQGDGTDAEEAREPLDAELAQQVRRQAQRHGVSAAALFHLALAVLLGRTTGKNDVVFGTVLLGRMQSGKDAGRALGMFINTLPLRIRLDAHSAEDCLRQTHKALTGLLHHEHASLSRAQRCSGLIGSTPLFSVLFNYRYTEALEGEVPAAWEGMEVLGSRERSNYPVAISVDDEGKGFKIGAQVTAAVGAQRLCSLMTEAIRGLVAALTLSPATRVGTLQVVPADELALLKQWGENPHEQAAAPVDANEVRAVHRRFEAQAEAQPDAVAVIFGDEALAYGALNARANRLAHRLIARGVKPETRVGIALERSFEMVVSILAVLKAGGAYVPMDPEYPVDRLAYMVQDSGIGLLLTSEALAGRMPRPEGEHCVLLVDREDLSGERSDNPGVPLHDHSLAYVIYTSGSTGKPKGVSVMHGPFDMHCRDTAVLYEMGPHSRELHFLSFAFDGAHERLHTALGCGASLVVRDDSLWTPEQTLAAMQRHGVTNAGFPPVYLRELAKEARDSGQCPPIHLYSFGGEAMPRDGFEAVCRYLKPKILINGYGPTEAVVTPMLWKVGADERCVPGYAPIGRPVGERSAHVLDADMNLVPRGVPGELYLGGAGLARGYLQRAGLTAERFVADPFGAPGGRLYRTGDLVQWSEDGQLEYLGRIDHQVKVRGFRIELGEIEAQLLQQPGVRQAVVVAAEGQGGARLVGYVGAGEGLDVPRLRQALGEALPDYMVPGTIVVLDKLPLNANGKIDRKALPTPEAAGADAPYEAPQGEVEAALAQSWVEVLGVARVGRQDNFFELGGDSILSLQIVARMRKAGWRITPRQLFERQTVALLATVAEAVQAGAQRPASLLEGEVPLLPIQADFLGAKLPVPSHWNQSVLLQPRTPVALATLRKALEAVIAHHDAFRLRFDRNAEGRWTQRYGTSAHHPAHELLWVRQARDAVQIEALCDEAQRSLDIAHGPLLRALAIEVEDGSQRLLLAVHHLAVDGVSWRILLEDLGTACAQLLRGEAVVLPEKTSSYKDWSQALQAHAAQLAQDERERAHWQALAEVPAQLPCDRPQGAATTAEQASVELRLDKAATEALLKDAPAAYRTQVNDILLTALGRSLCAWSGHERILVDLEGHGREDLFDGIDLTRTVGWFTSAFPVALAPMGEPGAALMRVKESLRDIPGKGLGFGLLRQRGNVGDVGDVGTAAHAQVVFNYLGQFDGDFDADALWTLAAEGMGVAVNEGAPMGHEFQVSGQVYAGELALRVMYSRARHDAASVQGWVNRFRQELLALIAHCTSGLADAQGVTPSDFPLAALEAGALDALVARLPEAATQIENIHPLAPGQQGMLFESSIAPGTEINVVQTLVHMVDLDPDRLKSAWQSTVARHAALRSGFHWLPQGEPMQVVLRQLEAPVQLLDWRSRHRDEAALEEAWDALCEEERLRGFDMARPPLARWVAVRVGDNAWRLAWTWHHILFDGWSVSRVMGELFALYAGQKVTSPLQPYADFVAAVRSGRDAKDEEKTYWQDCYADIGSKPTLLCGVPLQRWAAGGCDSRRVVLDASTTRALRAMAQAEQVTLNTLVQAAWALLLMQRTGREGVCFGVTMSGRSFEMRGIDDVVGLCVNSLPLMLRPDGAMGVGAWLRQIVSANLALRQREHAPLPRVQGWLGTPGQPLYDTLVIFENYPVDEAISRGAGPSLGIQASSGRGTLGVPLVLIVETKDEEMWLSFEHARGVFEPAGIAGLAAQMEGLVKALLQGAGRSVASLLESPVADGSALTRAPVRDAAASASRRVLPAVAFAALAETWRGVLSAPATPPRAHFFELGGDSLRAARLVVQWNERVDRERLPAARMQLRDVFEHPVLDELAAALCLPANRADFDEGRGAPLVTLEESL